jgi:uncharacterized protein
MEMQPRLNLLTLGVKDLNKAINFYRHGLGWSLSSTSVGDFAIFKLATDTALALYPRKLLAEDAKLNHHAPPFGGVAPRIMKIELGKR